jgi:hypothetical protein
VSNLYQRTLSLAGINVEGLSVEDLRSLVRAILDAKIHGICFGPYIEGQGPGAPLDSAQIRERLAIIQPCVRWVRTLAGWTTASNGRGIDPWNATEELQARYYKELMEWTTSENILTFVFEAFDEPWKGSHDPLEPEKHWGLFTVDRTPKLAMQELYTERLPVLQADDLTASADR